jgi:hypothetical protein
MQVLLIQNPVFFLSLDRGSESGIRDGEKSLSEIRDEYPVNFSESSETVFRVKNTQIL